MRRRQLARLQLSARDAAFPGGSNEEVRINDSATGQEAVPSVYESSPQIEDGERSDKQEAPRKQMRFCPKCNKKPAYHFHVINCKG